MVTLKKFRLPLISVKLREAHAAGDEIGVLRCSYSHFWCQSDHLHTNHTCKQVERRASATRCFKMSADENVVDSLMKLIFAANMEIKFAEFNVDYVTQFHHFAKNTLKSAPYNWWPRLAAGPSSPHGPLHGRLRRARCR